MLESPALKQVGRGDCQAKVVARFLSVLDSVTEQTGKALDAPF